MHRQRYLNVITDWHVLCAQLLGRQLSGVMLLSIEVAVEYWLALTWSPQAQWLNELAKSGVIQDEVCHSAHLDVHLIMRSLTLCFCSKCAHFLSRSR